MALICLGISGGTTLNHTDDLSALLTFHTGHSVLTHTPAGPDSGNGPCLACQWEASAFVPHVPVVQVVHLPLILASYQEARFETLAPHPFDHTFPRAPPRLAS